MTFTQLVKMTDIYFNLFMCNILHLVFEIILYSSYIPCYPLLNFRMIQGLEICWWWLAEKCRVYIYVYMINNLYLYIIIVYYVLVLYVASFKRPPAKYIQLKYDVIRQLELWETSKFVFYGIKEVGVCWQGRG